MLRRIIGFVFRTVIERGAAKRSLEELISNLESHGESLKRRLPNFSPTQQNINQLRHIIGIERWGQSRLRTLQGQSLIKDEYDSYQPESASNWDTLLEDFAQTRTLTINIARELQAKGVTKSATAFHNDAGELSLGGWLRYLDVHAGAEAKRLK